MITNLILEYEINRYLIIILYTLECFITYHLRQIILLLPNNLLGFSRFRRTRFQHVPREANKAAHGMAMEGWRYVNPQYWIEEVLQAVERLVAGERRVNREE
ncbi:hypothetical protein V6Z11_A05G364500 [Gossypium hirsutum]